MEGMHALFELYTLTDICTNVQRFLGGLIPFFREHTSIQR